MDANTSISNLSIIIELLSAGVLASLVTGIFSLVIAVKNNKKIVVLEKSKQSFTVQQEQYKQLLSAYNELLTILPEEEMLGHSIMNYRQHFDGEGRLNTNKFWKKAEENSKKIYSHYQKYSFLFDEEFCQSFENTIEDLDTIVKKIAALLDDADGYEDNIHPLVNERLLKVTQLEEFYFSSIRSQLSSMARKYKS